MEYKRVTATYQGREYVIEESSPEVGAYLFGFTAPTAYVAEEQRFTGPTEFDYLQDSMQECQEFAFEDYGVPLDAWRPLPPFIL
jgi:hypothetical protein